MMRAMTASAVTLAAVLMTGCGKVPPPVTPAVAEGPSGPSAAGAKYLLAEEPSGAQNVLAARADVKDGDEVVVVGRIGGTKKPFVAGRSSFTIVDPSLKPCPDEEGCPTPWDYCCTPNDELRGGSAQVKFVGADGKTLATDAKELLGVKELNTVVVKGKASRDEKGNLTVIASGLFVRRS